MRSSLASILISLGFLALFSYAVFEARDWPFAARLFPWLIGVPAVILALVQLFRDIFWAKTKQDQRASGVEMDEVHQSSTAQEVELRRTLAFFGWLLGLVIAVWFFSVHLALPAYVLAFARLQGERWRNSIVLAVITVLFVSVLFEYALGLTWPQGVFFAWLTE